jgi:hypothetical protein
MMPTGRRMRFYLLLSHPECIIGKLEGEDV